MIRNYKGYDYKLFKNDLGEYKVEIFNPDYDKYFTLYTEGDELTLFPQNKQEAHT